MQPWDQRFRGDVFGELVFTFLMNSKEVCLGNTLIGGPCNLVAASFLGHKLTI
jgi:hypothetical protein